MKIKQIFCTYCEEDKSMHEFYKSNIHKNGITGICVKCKESKNKKKENVVISQHIDKLIFNRCDPKKASKWR